MTLTAARGLSDRGSRHSSRLTVPSHGPDRALARRRRMGPELRQASTWWDSGPPTGSSRGSHCQTHPPAASCDVDAGAALGDRAGNPDGRDRGVVRGALKDSSTRDRNRDSAPARVSPRMTPGCSRSTRRGSSPAELNSGYPFQVAPLPQREERVGLVEKRVSAIANLARVRPSANQ